MRFEHIIQINDITQPDMPNLTRLQVWQGLVLRARRPDKFLVGVDDFEILDQAPEYLKRCVQMPGLAVIDEVWFTPESKLEYRAQPVDSAARSTLVMEIEEPEPEALFVRFTYTTDSIEDAGDSMPYDEYLREAYVATDVDTIMIIRELAAMGAF